MDPRVNYYVDITRKIRLLDTPCDFEMPLILCLWQLDNEYSSVPTGETRILGLGHPLRLQTPYSTYVDDSTCVPPLLFSDALPVGV